MPVNKKTIKYHLQRQTLRLVGLAYAVSWLIIITSSILQGFNNQNSALAGMASTSAAQVNLLLPSFLLPEERAGQDLLLGRIKDEENLSSIKLAGPDLNAIPLGDRGRCIPKNGNLYCQNMFPSYVTLIVPVGDGHQLFGHLIKTKNVEAGLLAKEFLPTVIILAIVILLSLLGLFVMVTRLASEEIPAAIDALLADVSKCLSNEVKSKPAIFRFQEFQDLSEAVDHLIRQARDGRKMSAIAQTTQMLAHDVRKPFSMLRMAMAMLGNAKDPAAVKAVMQRVVPEIDKAMSSVDGMISDVMEVGSTSVKLIQEPASPESLIESTLGEVIRMYPEANISFQYNLTHTHMAHVHVQKIGRVFSNIIGNAFQAMRNNGTIWFKTSEADGMITFCIGNAGSVIPEESLPKLFDTFFTSGKKGGTGLGMAIAQKVVNAHGGKIWCESSKTLEHPEGKVEFFFTLPVAKEVNRNTATLPQQSSDIAKHLVLLAASASSSLSIDKGELSLEEDVVQGHVATGRTLKLLIVDDEAIYRGALSSFLTRTPELANAVEITQADGTIAALQAVSERDFDLIITDVDMGAASLDGFELVRELRKKSSNSLICVHSNRIVAADNKTAIDAGADNFMPKPMARAQLLRIVLQAAEVGRVRDQRAAETIAVQASSDKPSVLVIDDAAFVIYAWEDMLSADTVLHTMRSFEELTTRIAADPSFLSSLNYVVTDMHLDGSEGDGLDVGRLIKKLRPELPVLMSSNDIFEDRELIGAVDKVIAKEAVGIAELKALRSGAVRARSQDT